jgi:hypothetical protein
MIDAHEPQKDDQGATQALDPEPVDDRCHVVDVPTADGRTVPVQLRTVAPLTGVELAMLGDVARAAIEYERRVNPHGEVIQELAASSFHARRVVRAASEPELADRQQRATRAAMDVIRAAQEVEVELRAEVERWRGAWQRGDRAWAADRAELAEKAAAWKQSHDAVRDRAIVLPEDWREQFFTYVDKGCDCESGTASRITRLVESWRAAPEPAALAKTRVWKRGDRVTWTDSFGTFFGVVLEDQIGSHVRVQPDNTDEFGALPASMLADGEK